jgi:hypothetical protein
MSDCFVHCSYFAGVWFKPLTPLGERLFEIIVPSFNVLLLDAHFAKKGHHTTGAQIFKAGAH